MQISDLSRAASGATPFYGFRSKPVSRQPRGGGIHLARPAPPLAGLDHTGLAPFEEITAANREAVAFATAFDGGTVR